jgi:hypothetical protein
MKIKRCFTAPSSPRKYALDRIEALRQYETRYPGPRPTDAPRTGRILSSLIPAPAPEPPPTEPQERKLMRPPPRPAPPVDKALAVRVFEMAHRRGWSATEIARNIGTHHRVVKQILDSRPRSLWGQPVE